jgi:hypothetical protein
MGKVIYPAGAGTGATGSALFTKSDTVPANGELIIDGSTAETGSVELHTFATEGPATVFKDVDIDGDGTFEIQVEVTAQGSAFHSQKNKIEVSSTDNARIRIVDTSGDGQGIHVTGIEVVE